MPASKPDLPRAEVMERLEITADLVVLKLRPEVEFEFQPGQYTTLEKDGIERAYSIVSSPHESILEIFVELVRPPAGHLTPLLLELKKGDFVSIHPGGKGTFTLEADRPNQFMVATVTGVAPFISMIRQYLHSGKRGLKFHLLHGASYQDEFGYREEMEALARKHPDSLAYVATVSRPGQERNRAWQGLTGRVNRMVLEQIQRFGLKPGSTRAYACGHPGMIQDVRKQLLPLGFEVKEEKYWTE